MNEENREEARMRDKEEENEAVRFKKLEKGKKEEEEGEEEAKRNERKHKKEPRRKGKRQKEEEEEEESKEEDEERVLRRINMKSWDLGCSFPFLRRRLTQPLQNNVF